MRKTTGQVCKELNIKPYKLDYLVRNRLVPEPQKTGSGHRMFSNKDINRIKEKLFEVRVK
jgi:DNA-binding transcriptional MerR regulator